MLKSRRLEGLLGSALEAVTVAQVRALVEMQAVEAFDLDFKAKLYGRSDAEKRDLAGDVAALANTAGGLIIIGITEDVQARAAAAPGVEVSDGEVARIRQVVAAGVSPLPAFDVINVHDDNSPSTGFVLIAVPRSVLAPHAVLINDALRFPTRNGSTTRYLSEPEVASAYRARQASAAERSDRIEHVEAALVDRLDLAENPWMTVSLVPDLPGDFLITRESFTDFEVATRSLRIRPLDGGGPSFTRFGVGRQRLRADDAMSNDDPAPWSSALEFHHDGAGVVALRLYDIRASVHPPVPDMHTLSDEGIAAAIISALPLLAREASERAHTAGMASLRVTVFPALNVKRTSIGQTRSGFSMASGRPVDGPVFATTFASIDELADEGAALLAAAARLHHEIGHSFGVPELPQLTLNGELAWPYWNHDRRPSVKAWAATRDVSIIGDK